MKKFLIPSLALILLVLLVPVFASAFGGVPFGGMMTSAVPCTCSPYTRITLKTSRGVISLDYRYGSQRYANFNLPLGRYMVGFYAPGPLCLDYVGESCIPRKTPPAIGTITPIVGSSLR